MSTEPTPPDEPEFDAEADQLARRHGMIPSDQDYTAIANGGSPTWTGTFDHPLHGELTFSGSLPRAQASLEHRIAMDNRLGELSGPPRGGTQLLVAALAGMTAQPETPGQGLFVKLPVIAEDREEADDDSGSVKVTRTFYDPDAEIDVEFLVEVWTAYSIWRSALLNGVDRVKGSSGEPTTSGSASSETSSAPSVSPSTIPA